LEALAVLLLGVTVFGEKNITPRVVLAALVVVAGAALITTQR
jgi:drug/metabolite transporter (DMT)-like permease